jgi:uncharacterized membrane protein YqjE
MRTPAAEPSNGGIRGAVRRVSEHASAVARLELELASVELKKKATSLGIGIGLAVGALLFFGLALIWGLAAATAGLTGVLPLWAALLAMCGTLFVFGFILATLGVAYLRRGSNVMPEEALAEAQITRQELQEELHDAGIT